MRHYPILFSTPMVQAILEGRKTQTRRVVKPQPTNFVDDPLHYLSPVPCISVNLGLESIKCPYGQPGDVLWVRETWCYIGDTASADNDKNRFHYLASKGKNNFTWKPSIHMPKEACRLFLRVKSVRVERLQEITRGDAMDEGCPFANMADGPNPKDWFNNLWQSINSPESWDANPWVWVVEFERITKEEAGI